MTFAFADGHNDLLLELVHRKREPDPFATWWEPKLRTGSVVLTVCGVSVTNDGRPPEDYPRRVLEYVAAFERAVGDGGARRVLERSDLDTLSDGGPPGLLLDLEGLEPLGDDPSLALAYHALGFRSWGLTWNHANAFGSGVGSEDGGLTDAGREVLAILAHLPGVVDLAHAGPRTFAEALDVLPPGKAWVSHAGCRSVHDHARNLDDEQLRALRDHGGIFGLLIHPLTVDPAQPTVERLLDHLDHAVAVLGVDRVAIGSDFQKQVSEALDRQELPAALLPPGMRVGDVVEGLEGPEHFPVLADALRERDYAESDAAAIASGNLLRFLRDAL